MFDVDLEIIDVDVNFAAVDDVDFDFDYFEVSDTINLVVWHGSMDSCVDEVD